MMDNPVASTSNRARESITRKKRMKTQQTPNNNEITVTKTSWKSQATQQLYSSKLLSALRHVRESSSSTTTSSSAPRRSRAVREAADKALAIAAKGRTRWSRAILTNRLRLQFMSKKHKRQRVAPPTLPPPSRKLEVLKLMKGKEKGLPGVERKVKTLGMLVPGCRKETLPVILEEATDYIPALEMQIRAMRELLSRLSAGGGGGGDGEGSSSGSSMVVDDSSA